MGGTIMTSPSQWKLHTTRTGAWQYHAAHFLARRFWLNTGLTKTPQSQTLGTGSMRMASSFASAGAGTRGKGHCTGNSLGAFGMRLGKGAPDSGSKDRRAWGSGGSGPGSGAHGVRGLPSLPSGLGTGAAGKGTPGAERCASIWRHRPAQEGHRYR